MTYRSSGLWPMEYAKLMCANLGTRYMIHVPYAEREWCLCWQQATHAATLCRLPADAWVFPISCDAWAAVQASDGVAGSPTLVDLP